MIFFSASHGSSGPPAQSLLGVHRHDPSGDLLPLAAPYSWLKPSPRRRNIVFLLYGGYVIDIYDGCLSVADYLCGPVAICGASHVNCMHFTGIWTNGRVVQNS